MWLHKMRVAKAEEDAPEHGYQLEGEDCQMQRVACLGAAELYDNGV